ncbi:hypothetical protein BN2537_2889 [Streptomyces venezuelae]|nr:hypothetical protein BN2537_2889 [Streptomyces venezuelae]
MGTTRPWAVPLVMRATARGGRRSRRPGGEAAHPDPLVY